ncbi:hypothetical protein HN51_005079, partial [Arachis hypogaea]
TCTLNPTCEIYIMSRSSSSRKEWQVSHYCDSSIFKCPCLWMESLDILCDHIVAVLAYVKLIDMSDSLVLDRSSKKARSKVRAFMEKKPFCWNSTITCRNWMLNDLCREMCVLTCCDEAEFVDMTDKLRYEILDLKQKKDYGDLGG